MNMLPIEHRTQPRLTTMPDLFPEPGAHHPPDARVKALKITRTKMVYGSIEWLCAFMFLLMSFSVQAVTDHIIMYPGGSHDGNMGGRAGGDALCAASAAKPDNYMNYKILVGIDITDSPKNMPSTHGAPDNVPIKGNKTGNPLIGNNWADLFDSDGIANPLRDSLTAIGNTVYGGGMDTTAYGVVGATNTIQNCQGFTSNDSADRRSAGDATVTTKNWTYLGSSTCDVSHPFLCVAWDYQAVTALNTNLLQNPGAEEGIIGWNASPGPVESLAGGECGSVTPYSGSKAFAVGGICSGESATGQTSQSVNISTHHASDIDAHRVFVQFGGVMRGMGGDKPEIELVFRDSNGIELSRTAKLSHSGDIWTAVLNTATVPANTRQIDFMLYGTRVDGSDNDSYFDDLQLQLNIPTPSNTYNFETLQPGNLNGQRGWTVNLTRTAVDAQVMTDNGSQVIKSTTGGSGVMRKGYLRLGGELVQPNFADTSQLHIFEFDNLQNWWGSFGGLATDSDDDGIADSIGVGVRNVGADSSFRFQGQTVSSVGGWSRFRVVMDMGANSGQGKACVLYKNPTSTSTWVAPAAFQAVNMGFNSSASDATNPATWNTLHFDFQTDAGGMDNVLLTDFTPLTQLSMSANSVAENSTVGTTVGSFLGGSGYIYQLISGSGDTDNALFSITGDSLNTQAMFDFETQSSYSIRVKASHPDYGDCADVEQVITINVSDVLELSPPRNSGSLKVISAGADQIDLSWMDGSDNETGFEIYRSLDAGNTWENPITVGRNIEAYSDTDVLCETAYSYKVRAYNSVGRSGATSTRSATTDTCVATEDSDGDGLTNAEEAQLGTDPNIADSDGDGMSDAQEVNAGTDPLKNDYPLCQPEAVDIAAGTKYLQSLLGESCFLYDLNGFCSVQGDCGKRGHLDESAHAEGEAITNAPLRNATGFNVLGKYFGVVYGERKVWIQVESNACSIAAGGFMSQGDFVVGASPKKCAPADSDHDGLSDEQEATLGTDPNNADSDSDGLPDAKEVNTHQTDPNAADSDGDGLSDADEINTHNTDPNQADSDADGLSDADEINTHKTDPNQADSDADGVSDGDEINTHKTDPNQADSDADGLSDGDEINTHKTHPLQADSDDDGVNDGTEISDATDPLNDKECSALTCQPPQISTRTERSAIPPSGLKTTCYFYPDKGNCPVVNWRGYTYWAFSYQNNATAFNIAAFDCDGKRVKQWKKPGARYIHGINVDKTAQTVVFTGQANKTVVMPWSEMELPVLNCADMQDTDGDGLSDAEEAKQGTDPNKADSDDDGLSDADEIQRSGLDPKKADSDADGLSDGEEVNTHQTNPAAMDTDNDGVNDKDEIDAGTDPLNPPLPDTDEDGLSDEDETLYGTAVDKYDTDRDGSPDGVEVKYGTDPLTAGVDTDRDYLLDEIEIQLGSDPNAVDSDGDTLIDGNEVNLYGSDPTLVDTDGDGLSDADEVNQYGGNPLLVDTDKDGLDDAQEVSLGTFPYHPDTDEDGLSDGDEVNVYHTDPKVADTDAEGTNDGVEASYQTDPTTPNPDTDSDGLIDEIETQLGTDPSVADSDGDGLSDGDEVNQHNTNPTVVDSDGDTLSDGDEVNTHGSNPKSTDTDEDTLSDDFEVNTSKTNPTIADTDGDGLSDAKELDAAVDTNPLQADSDGDGFNDGEEIEAGTDPNNPDVDPQDFDGDGLTNAEEENLGSSPYSADTDKDGRNDKDEMSQGTHPKIPDSLNNCMTPFGTAFAMKLNDGSILDTKTCVGWQITLPNSRLVSNNGSIDVSQDLSIKAGISPQAADVGQSARLIILVKSTTAQGEQWLMKNAQQQWAVWDGTVAGLQSVSNTTLSQGPITVDVQKGRLNNLSGNISLCVGYDIKGILTGNCGMNAGLVKDLSVEVQLDNVALKKSAQQSSTVSGGNASRAVDGNTSGRWGDNSLTHTHGKITKSKQVCAGYRDEYRGGWVNWWGVRLGGHWVKVCARWTSQTYTVRNDKNWWQVDLGADYDINHIVLHNRTDCCRDRLRNFKVFVGNMPFDSGASENALKAQSNWYKNFAGKVDENATLKVKSHGRYVRVQHNMAGEYLSLAEVEVFGKKAERRMTPGSLSFGQVYRLQNQSGAPSSGDQLLGSHRTRQAESFYTNTRDFFTRGLLLLSVSKYKWIPVDSSLDGQPVQCGDVLRLYDTSRKQSGYLKIDGNGRGCNSGNMHCVKNSTAINNSSTVWKIECGNPAVTTSTAVRLKNLAGYGGFLWQGGKNNATRKVATYSSNRDSSSQWKAVKP